MAKLNRYQRAKAQEKLKREKERERARNFREIGPHLIKVLKYRGSHSPFYDYLESYREQFDKIAAAAPKAHPSLLGVHEVADEDYYSTDWDKLGYLGYKQVFYTTTEEIPDYGKHKVEDGPAANLSGFMATLIDPQGAIRSVILLQRDIESELHDNDQKYLLKVAALLHEIGHVDDLEKRINFDPETKRMDVIAAEVYAQLYCLRELAERGFVMTYRMLVDTLRGLGSSDGYLGRVAREALAAEPQRDIKCWIDDFGGEAATEEELRILGSKGRVLLSTLKL